MHLEKQGVYGETNILYKDKVLDITTADADLNSMCDYCSRYNHMDGDEMMIQSIKYPYLQHELEMVCPRCGTRYTFIPTIMICYQLKSCNDKESLYYDENYTSLTKKHNK